MKKIVMEFLGTFFLVLTIVMTANPLAIASILMAWIYIGGSLSGAHYNPLVSLAVVLRGKMADASLLYYMGAQLCGSFVAYALAAFFHGHIAMPQPSAHAHIGEIFMAELLISFVFVLIVLVTANSDRFRTSHVYGFAIGFTVPALIFLAAPISGALFNPALAVGGALFGLLQGASVRLPVVITYLLAEFGGAFAAVHCYKYFFPFDR